MYKLWRRIGGAIFLVLVFVLWAIMPNQNIRITSPKADTVLHPGNTQRVTWMKNYVDIAKLSLKKAEGGKETLLVIGDGLRANEIDWTVATDLKPGRYVLFIEGYKKFPFLGLQQMAQKERPIEIQ